MAGTTHYRHLIAFTACIVLVIGGLLILAKSGTNTAPTDSRQNNVVKPAAPPSSQDRASQSFVPGTTPYVKDQRLLTERGKLLASSYGDSVATQILNEKVWIGMTADMLLEVKGKPGQINRTVRESGTEEQWVYYVPVVVKRIYSAGYRQTVNQNYYYVEDGILTTIQETE